MDEDMRHGVVFLLISLRLVALVVLCLLSYYVLFVVDLVHSIVSAFMAAWLHGCMAAYLG